MDLFIGGRRTGKTHYILQKFLFLLDQGERPRIVVSNYPERVNLIDSALKIKPTIKRALLQKLIVTAKQYAEQPDSDLNRNPVFIDNLDYVLQSLFGNVTEMTITNINIRRLGANPFISLNQNKSINSGRPDQADQFRPRSNKLDPKFRRNPNYRRKGPV